jgi:hypothetical protein
VTDCVDAVVQSVQVARGAAAVHGGPVETDRSQLTDGNDSMLPAGDVGDCSPCIGWAIKVSVCATFTAHPVRVVGRV